MANEKELQEKLNQLQLLQQRLQLFVAQKQQFQLKLAEIENALKELQKSKDEVYKLVGGILVKADPGELKKELEEQKENLNIRIKAIAKQEERTKEQALRLQKELAEKLK